MRGVKHALGVNRHILALWLLDLIAHLPRFAPQSGQLSQTTFSNWMSSGLLLANGSKRDGFGWLFVGARAKS